MLLPLKRGGFCCMEIEKRLEQIEWKIKRMALQMDQLKSENARLNHEKLQLETDLSNQKNLVGLLKNKLTETQRSLEEEREQDPQRSEALKNQIDQYLLEIDKCIEWIQNA